MSVNVVAHNPDDQPKADLLAAYLQKKQEAEFFAWAMDFLKHPAWEISPKVFEVGDDWMLPDEPHIVESRNDV